MPIPTSEACNVSVLGFIWVITVKIIYYIWAGLVILAVGEIYALVTTGQWLDFYLAGALLLIGIMISATSMYIYDTYLKRE